MSRPHLRFVICRIPVLLIEVPKEISETWRFQPFTKNIKLTSKMRLDAALRQKSACGRFKGQLMIGLDLGDRSSSYCVVDEAGKASWNKSCRQPRKQ